MHFYLLFFAYYNLLLFSCHFANRLFSSKNNLDRGRSTLKCCRLNTEIDKIFCERTLSKKVLMGRKVQSYSFQEPLLSSCQKMSGSKAIWIVAKGQLISKCLLGAFNSPKKRTKTIRLEVLYHTAGLDTIFVQIYMDVLPGVPGVSKNQNFYFTNKTVEFLR